MTGSDNPDEIWKPSPAFKRFQCFDCFNQYECDQDDTMITPNCFKKIPKGFEWDAKHREWIDTRCNNPKLKKLCKESVRVDVKLKREKNNMVSTPAICITPFNTVPLKRIRKKKRNQK